MRVAILQFNSLIGAISENCARIVAQIESAAEKADLFVLPELSIVGYPPRDLLSMPHYLDAESAAVEELKVLSEKLKIGILVNHCERSESAPKGLWNCATLFDSGRSIGKVRKSRLPYYDIFEEERFFSPFTDVQQNLRFRNQSLGIFICEDAWDEIQAFGKSDLRKHSTTSASLKRIAEADLLINISASPFFQGKTEIRQQLFAEIARDCGKPLCYANSAGAQDEIIFDGRSFAVDEKGAMLAQAKAFSEDIFIVDLSARAKTQSPAPLSRWQDIADGLTLGIADYARKTGFKKIVLGLSGGIDSALVAWLAQQAVGAENVLAISIPTQFNSSDTKADARIVAANLNVEFRETPVQNLVDAFSNTLGLAPSGLPLENLQSRIRGIVLMAESNRSGSLLLACGNKSELAMGYSTLYGDLCGGLLPIGDLFKTEVYGLCQWINANSPRPVFPATLMTRAPSAELAPGQKDSDSLPDYSVLDSYLRDFIEDQGLHAIEWKNFPDAKTNGYDLFHRMQRQEFKRRQSAPILKIHGRSFGSAWRMPIAKSDGLTGVGAKRE